MVYLRYPHPERIYDGMAPALVAGLAAETDTAAQRFNKELLTNDAGLPGYLILKGLTPDGFKEWKQEWDAGSTAGKTRFLSGDQATYTATGQTNQELTYSELRQDSQDDIMRAFGVPRAVAMDVSHETYANADREQAIFMQHNVLPKWVLVCDELTLQLGVDASPPVRIAMDLTGIDELQDSADAQVERAMKLMSMKAMTINEFRRTKGWPDVAWGDEPMEPLQPMSAVPLQPGGTANPPKPTQPEVKETVAAAPVAPATNGHPKE
jgi:phage portal protein BeeE